MDWDALSTSRKLVFCFCLLLMITGIVILAVWTLVFGVVQDIGLYAVTVMLVGFGLVGALLYSMPETEGETGPR